MSKKDNYSIQLATITSLSDVTDFLKINFLFFSFLFFYSLSKEQKIYETYSDKPFLLTRASIKFRLMLLKALRLFPAAAVNFPTPACKPPKINANRKPISCVRDLC